MIYIYCTVWKYRPKCVFLVHHFRFPGSKRTNTIAKSATNADALYVKIIPKKSDAIPTSKTISELIVKLMVIKTPFTKASLFVSSS